MMNKLFFLFLFVFAYVACLAQDSTITKIKQILNPNLIALQYNDAGSWVDTMVFRPAVSGFADSSQASFRPLQLKNTSFNLDKSSLHGMGLFTRSNQSFSIGDTVAKVFNKTGNTNVFMYDYVENHIGFFVNDNRVNPNTECIKYYDGVYIIAIQDIAPNTEISANYLQLLDLFNGDLTLKRMIKYW